MKNNMQPELILDQLSTLGDIHREHFTEIDASVRRAFSALELESLSRVYALGDGDSYHAALASEMAFGEFSKVSYYPTPAFQFLAYDSDFVPSNFPRDTLVVGISASGGSSKVAESIKKARKINEGVLVAGMVGNEDSRVADAAGRMISVQLPELGRSPGIRTYTASLMGLLSLAIRIGEIKRVYHMEDANHLRQEIIDLAYAVDRTFQMAVEPAKIAAKAVRDAKFISFTGSGPSFGSAYFSGAKVVESAGVFPGIQDLEEWAHVERFSYPIDFPVFLIAPPGKSYWRALELAKGVKLIGHPLLAVVSAQDTEIAQMADYIFPVQAETREAFSPLLYYIAGTTFAYYLTKELGRCMFMTDNLNVMAARQEMMQQIQGKKND
jgi:glucosamine--fructose-6-phosphate aminotransferase (isomerizing)